MLDGLLADARHIRRRVRRAPAVALTVILSLAVGMASVLGLLGVVDSLFFRDPPGVRDPERIVAIGPWAGYERTTYPDYVDLRDQARTLQSAGAFAFWNYSARVGSTVTPARGLLASHSLLPTLGIEPVAGRRFTPDEDHPGATAVALISADFRRQHFATDAAALGGMIRLAGIEFDIIGVLPASFTAPDMSPIDLVLPIENAPWFGGREALVNRDYQWVRIVGRLRPGISPAAASAEATAIYRRANVGVRSVDQTTLAQERIAVQSLREARLDPKSASARLSLWLTLLAAVVLLIACGNVASVLVARGIADAPELAIHVALGASRWRLASRSMAEVGVLVAIATIFGVALAAAMSKTLSTLLLASSVAPPPLDGRTVAIAAAVATFCSVASALAPVLRATRTDPHTVLGSHSRTTTGSHGRALRVLVGAQIALGVVLVSEAGVFAASLRNATRVDLGFDLSRLAVADVDLRAAGFTDATAPAAAMRALDAVRRIPGVTAAGMTNAASIPGFFNPPLVVPGRDSVRGLDDGEPFTNVVTPGFLEALAVPLRRGRLFTDDDITARRPVALVSERFARLFWASEDPIGQCVRIGRLTTTPCAPVVGVVGDRRGGPTATHGVAEIYVPAASAAMPEALAKTFVGREIAVRVTPNRPAIAADLQRVLLDAIPALTSVRVRIADAYLEAQTRSWRLGAVVIGAFAVIALVLAAVGIFGAWSHAVATRRRELGIRGALGAKPGDLAALVLREALLVSSIGVLVGLIASVPAGRLVSAMTFGISPLDPLVFVASAIVFAFVTCSAALAPAFRAALTDPRTVLAAD
jgi:predicted permease